MTDRRRERDGERKQGKPAYTTTIRKLAKALEVEPGELVEPKRQGED